jgi:hypothetical protein
LSVYGQPAFPKMIACPDMACLPFAMVFPGPF